jgi:hypothetical protein
MPSSLHLSASELRDLITDGDMQEIVELTIDFPALLPLFHHFASLSRTLRRLEELQRLTLRDLDLVFEDMTREDFDDAFVFFITQRRRERGSPYARPSTSLRRSPVFSSPPSSPTSISTSSSSYYTARSTSPSLDPNDIVVRQPSPGIAPPLGQLYITPPLGSVFNPIDVDRFPTPPPYERHGTPIPRVGILHRPPRRSPPTACHTCRRPNRTCTVCRWRRDEPRGRT